MSEDPARRALGAATAALAAASVCVAFLLPPLVQRTVGSALRVAATGLALALALLLHWACVGIAARRMGRSVAGWVALSALLFPVGSAAALVLLAWLDDDGGRRQPAHHTG